MDKCGICVGVEQKVEGGCHETVIVGGRVICRRVLWCETQTHPHNKTQHFAFMKLNVCDE